jgi:hypothetical protein
MTPTSRRRESPRLGRLPAWLAHPVGGIHGRTAPTAAVVEARARANDQVTHGAQDRFRRYDVDDVNPSAGEYALAHAGSERDAADFFAAFRFAFS